ncbi:transposase family protein [Streptomyces sp. NPDC002076]
MKSANSGIPVHDFHIDSQLHPCLESVPGPRSRRGRWYSLTAILLVRACVAIGGAKSIDELAEFGERATPALLASLGVRRHLLGWRRSPRPVTIGRVLAALDGEALDQAVGAYLADTRRTTTGESATRTRQVIAVDGKALKGSARLGTPHRHLLSAGTHAPVATLNQVEVGATTNEALPAAAGATRPRRRRRHLRRPALGMGERHLAHRDEENALHRRDQDQPAHRIRPLAALPWADIAVPHSASRTSHRRRESRSIKNCAIADNLDGIAFPHAKLAVRVHRRRRPTTSPRAARTSMPPPASTPARPGPAELAATIRGHWGVENSAHHIRDVTFAEGASTVHAGSTPRTMAGFRNLAIGILKILGADNIAKTTRTIRHDPEQALAILGITNNPDTYRT